jgi:hypothetical protein
MSKPPILAVDLSCIDTIPKLLGLLLGSIGPGITRTARAAGKGGTHDDYRGSREDSKSCEFC